MLGIAFDENESKSDNEYTKSCLILPVTVKASVGIVCPIEFKQVNKKRKIVNILISRNFLKLAPNSCRLAQARQ